MPDQDDVETQIQRVTRVLSAERPDGLPVDVEERTVRSAWRSATAPASRTSSASWPRGRRAMGCATCASRPPRAPPTLWDRDTL